MPARILTLCACLLMAACGQKTADETYRAYNDEIMNGAGYEVEKSFYTERKQAEVEEQIPVYMERMGKERDEVLAMYSQFSQDEARCNAIELVEEQSDDDSAYLEYAQTNTCGEEPEPAGKQKIRMIMTDDGWKIDELEVEL